MYSLVFGCLYEQSSQNDVWLDCPYILQISFPFEFFFACGAVDFFGCNGLALTVGWILFGDACAASPALAISSPALVAAPASPALVTGSSSGISSSVVLCDHTFPFAQV